jgi:hypothetical protein
MAIERPPRDACPLRDREVGGVGGAEGVVKLDRGVDDLLPGLVLAFSPASKRVLPSDFRELPCDVIIDKRSSRRYSAIQYTTVILEY